jgi:molybdopterin converting factor small subunit
VTIPAEGWTVAELRGTLCAGDVAAASALTNPRVRVAIDQEIAFDDRRVYPGQEVAFLAPVSGG